MIKPEDDTRKFWIFLQECGCPIAVLTDEGYTRTQAFRRLYDGVRATNQAIDRGVTARHVDAPTYHDAYFEQMKPDWRCPHQTGS